MEELSLKVKEKRGGRGVRETAAEIGISPATLSRVESGKQPDLVTFRALCSWLNIDPSLVLGMQTPRGLPPDMPVQAHFRAHKTMSVDTANHLANLILAIQRTADKGF